MTAKTISCDERHAPAVWHRKLGGFADETAHIDEISEAGRISASSLQASVNGHHRADMTSASTSARHELACSFHRSEEMLRLSASL